MQMNFVYFLCQQVIQQRSTALTTSHALDPRLLPPVPVETTPKYEEI